MTTPFFIEDIRNMTQRGECDPNEQRELEQYLEERRGAPDGSTDGEWQTIGKGYYSHLHELDSLKTEEKRSAYLERLRKDIAEMDIEFPGHHQVQVVREYIEREFGGRG